MKTPNHIGNLAPTIEGLQAQIASLTAEIERLREALQTADETLIEINLNNSSIEASQIIRAALQPKEGNQ
jgi:prefoldin subunit 5